MSSASSTIRVSGLGQRTIASLKSQAEAEGLSIERYIKKLIENDMSISEMAKTKPIDQVFSPIQKRFRESRMSEDELDRLVDTARTEHHKRRMRKRR